MNKIFLKYADGRVYLVGFALNLRDFIWLRYSDMVEKDSIYFHDEGSVSFYHLGLKQRVNMFASKLIENEKCYLKRVAYNE
jgi:hypothetical protein